jgi:1-acyl-sn-glycerol-3-phosphate acyltransferase
MLKTLCSLFLKIAGWKIVDNIPNGLGSVKRCVMIAAPHTSNWDYPYTLATFFAIGVKIKYLAKKSLFTFPLGIIIKGAGGIAVDRTKHNNLVDALINLFVENEELILTIPAEGTRGFVKEWKSGFYHVALGAKVPIVLGYCDYGKKEVGFQSVFHPTGDYDKDLIEIQKFYKTVTPKYSENFSLKDVTFD